MERILIKDCGDGYELFYQDNEGTRYIGKTMAGVLDTIKIFFKLEGLETKEI